MRIIIMSKIACCLLALMKFGGETESGQRGPEILSQTRLASQPGSSLFSALVPLYDECNIT